MTTPMPEWVDAWAMAKRSDDPTLLLVTITHPNFETVRLVNNTEDFVSRGETYKASWFEVDWVNDDGEMPRCSLSVPNVVPAEIGQRYLGQVVAPEASLEIVAVTEPDEPIRRVARLELRGLSVDPVVVTGILSGKDHSAEPLGTIVVLPSNFSALFRRQRKT